LRKAQNTFEGLKTFAKNMIFGPIFQTVLSILEK